MKVWLILIAMLLFAGLSASKVIIIDNTQPVVVIERPTTASPAYTTENQMVNITFNYTERNPRNYTITIFNSTIVVCFKFVALNPGLDGGVNVTVNDNCTLSGTINDNVYSLRVNLTDVVGNTSSNTQTNAVSLDTRFPVVVNVTPANDSEITTSELTFSVDTNETAECRYSDSSGTAFDQMTIFANTNSTTHSSVFSLSEFGTYSLYIRCKDPAGNTNPNDFPTRFHYVGSTAFFGHSVTMNFGLKIGNNKSDDTVRRTNNYAISADSSNGTVFAIVFSGSRAFTSSEDRNYTATDYLFGLTQSSDSDKYLIIYTKGSEDTVRSKANDLGDGKIPSKTFYDYVTSKPDMFKVYIILQYADLHLTGKQSWRGAGKLLIKNNGNADDGLANV
ncbi:MAG: hypothetical protein QMD11_13140, partial [Smithella sp.]|nr:hypothetical protein [Smithella sp.]